jgi:hypothetical protein
MNADEQLAYRSLLRETFREAVKRLLAEHGPLETSQLYHHVRRLHPELRDDDIECSSGGEPEWTKQLRWAQQDLKQEREIELVGRKWRVRVRT